MGLQRYPLTDQAYDAIKQQIMDQSLKPGDRVVISSIAAALECGTGSVREALARLRAEELVAYIPNQGFQVSPLMNRDEFCNMFDVRHLLERRAAELAAKSISSQAIKHLKRTLAVMADTPEDPEYRHFREFESSDESFHRTIFEATGNPLLARLYDDLHIHLQLARFYRARGSVDVAPAVAEHQRILDALASHEAAGAMEAMDAHLSGSFSRLQPSAAPG